MRVHVFCPSVTCAVRSANRTHFTGHIELHTHACLENPSVPNPLSSLASVRRGIGNIHHGRFRTGFHSRRRARGGLVRSTARTSRSLPCKPGAVLNTATAAARPLSLICRSLRRTLALKLLFITLSLGDAAACSRMPTVISLTYSNLTHTILLTHAVTLTRGVSLTHGVSVTHSMLGSTHFGTLATTPLTHGVSFTHGVSVTRGVSFTHAAALTHTLAPTLCARCSTHFTTLVNTHTLRQSHWRIVSPQGFPGPPYPPSSSCTRSQHSPPLTRLTRTNSPGHDQLQGRIASPSVPEGGYPAARTGSQNILPALPHGPPLPQCVCARP